MSDTPINGQCLCGDVHYQITGNIGIFQYCHCSRCRKVTGSAHASNLFVNKDDFHWTAGEELVGRYEPEDAKYFATCFCKQCGSNLPWLSRNEKIVIVPAGALEQHPNIEHTQNIFWGSKAVWYHGTEHLPKHENLPPRE